MENESRKEPRIDPGCKYDELADPNTLKQDPRNRNKHKPEQLEAIAKVLSFQGWRRPVSVSMLTGHVTAGWGRVCTAKKYGWKVPIVYQTYTDADQQYADIIADNAIAKWANLDRGEINNDLQDLELPDLDVLGMEGFDIDPKAKEKKKMKCPKCGEEFLR